MPSEISIYFHEIVNWIKLYHASEILTVKIPEPMVIDPLSPNGWELFRVLGKTSGIYAFAVPGRVTHLSWSTNLPRRLRRLLYGSDGAPSILANRLGESAATVQYWLTSSRLESSLLLYELAKTHFTDDYLLRLRLRMPWFVALTGIDRFARLTITNRLGRGDGSAIGPFPSREGAQRYGEEVLGSFFLRRCSEELSPAPEHPGCIYGEMNLCLRPCQCAVSESEYRREAEQVEDFLLTNGKNTLARLTLQRDQAASDTDFETAAQIHKRIEKLKLATKSRDEVITNVQHFSGVAVTPGREAHQVRLWPMVMSYWQDPLTLDLREGYDAETLSFHSRLQQVLTPVFSRPTREGQQEENLAMFARWYYSSFRDGDWIAFTDADKANHRKLARRLSKWVKEGAKNEAKIS
ncbi:MAG: UvrB/UvrC motif-containing protein [Acidobacteriaceae bacterium]|nr:UvrB/UvrC motif-containing protein [Acidobacteriaceae bacterium]